MEWCTGFCWSHHQGWSGVKPAGSCWSHRQGWIDMQATGDCLHVIIWTLSNFSLFTFHMRFGFSFQPDLQSLKTGQNSNNKPWTPPKNPQYNITQWQYKWDTRLSDKWTQSKVVWTRIYNDSTSKTLDCLISQLNQKWCEQGMVVTNTDQMSDYPANQYKNN